MSRTTAEDYLSRNSLLRLLAVLARILAPHLTRVPPWIALAVVAVGAWRVAARTVLPTMRRFGKRWLPVSLTSC